MFQVYCQVILIPPTFVLTCFVTPTANPRYQVRKLNLCPSPATIGKYVFVTSSSVRSGATLSIVFVVLLIRNYAIYFLTYHREAYFLVWL